jgi:ribose-phosphate pyrophosphokinase
MANNFVFNDSLPVAPLKLAALESCRDFASKVNDHIVQFRRNDIEELTCATADMMWIPICWTATARALALARQKA